jgi:hypothetical protein
MSETPHLRHIHELPPHRIIEIEPSPARGIVVGMALAAVAWGGLYALVRRLGGGS